MESGKFEEDQFRAAVNAFVGRPCWGVAAGEGTGSRFGLDLGQKIPRNKPLANPYLSEDMRNFNGEYRLFVEGCPWRVQSPSEVIGSWLDDNANDGPMVRTLERLVGANVHHVRLEAPAWDLWISFNNGLTLCVFPDATGDTEWDDNYTVLTPSGAFSVERYGKLTFETTLPEGFDSH